MKVLKQLSEDNLVDISNFLANEVNNEIYKVFSPKELLDIGVDVNIHYDEENIELDVDVDVNIETDCLKDVDEDLVSNIIDIAYGKLDNYIDANYKENKVE